MSASEDFSPILVSANGTTILKREVGAHVRLFEFPGGGVLCQGDADSSREGFDCVLDLCGLGDKGDNVTIIEGFADDGFTPLGPFAREIIDFSDIALRNGQKMLVHCHKGFSRATTASALILMVHADIPPRNTVALIRSAGWHCSPNLGLMRDLECFWKHLSTCSIDKSIELIIESPGAWTLVSESAEGRDREPEAETEFSVLPSRRERMHIQLFTDETIKLNLPILKR